MRTDGLKSFTMTLKGSKTWTWRGLGKNPMDFLENNLKFNNIKSVEQVESIKEVFLKKYDTQKVK